MHVAQLLLGGSLLGLALVLPRQRRRDGEYGAQCHDGEGGEAGGADGAGHRSIIAEPAGRSEPPPGEGVHAPDAACFNAW
ncbi:hypothetical protein GCM10028797_18840 [Dyella agri]